MKKFSPVVLTFFCLTTGLMAQHDETLFGEAGLRLTGAWGGITTGTSIFASETVPNFGSFGGVEFNRTLFVGFGNERTTQSVDFEGIESGSFKLRHRQFLLGITPLSHRVLHPRISFAMGGGKVELDDGRDDKIFVVQPAAGLEVNVFQWWKLGLEGGYRFVSRANIAGLSNEDLSAFFVNLRLRFGFSWGNND